jgi:hypothetical protein
VSSLKQTMSRLVRALGFGSQVDERRIEQRLDELAGPGRAPARAQGRTQEQRSREGGSVFRR